MARLHSSFDATAVDPSSPLEAFPAGDYPMIIADSKIKPTKDRNGEYLQLTCEVIDGPYKGRKVWDRLNLVNRNPTAVAIAEATLSALCHAVGVLHVQDSQELHDKPFLGKVRFVPAEGRFDAKNEISGYKPLSQPAGRQAARSEPAPADSAARSTAEPAPAPADNGPPWRRR